MAEGMTRGHGRRSEPGAMCACASLRVHMGQVDKAMQVGNMR